MYKMYKKYSLLCTLTIPRLLNFASDYYFFFFLLCQVLIAACGIQFPDQGANLGPLHWELGVLVTGPPGKSLMIAE